MNGGGRPALVGDLLQQGRVDVDTDAEREDPPSGAGCPCGPARRIAASEVCPTVASPSVMNRTIGSVPSAGGCRRASRRASWMFVPPRAVIDCEELGHAVASSDRDFRTGRSENGSTPSL